MIAKYLMISALVFMTGLILLGTGLYHYSHEEILIESLESKTLSGNSVFNKISFENKGSLEIWKMRQSHEGIHLSEEKWDYLKIVIDKNVSPNKVSYFQYELENGQEIQRPYRVSCYNCHANGPRVIRPKKAGLSLKQKLLISLWNLKIKSYKGLIADEKNEWLLGEKRKIPFKLQGHFPNEKLKIKTCLICHSEDGFLQRGPLTRQQSGTIAYLTENNDMPPWPFSLNAMEKKELEHFIKGH